MDKVIDGYRRSPTVRWAKGPTVVLISGRRLDLLDIDRSTFDIVDVAHALSNICRFGGHTRTFYSVAQHSVLMTYHVAPRNRLATLLHDAPEFAINDQITQVKDLCPDYRRLENEIAPRILARLGVVGPMDPEIKEIDIRMMVTEQHQLVEPPASDPEWDETRGRDLLPIRIKPWPPAKAKRLFLARHGEIMRADGGRDERSWTRRIAEDVALRRVRREATGGSPDAERDGTATPSATTLMGTGVKPKS